MCPATTRTPRSTSIPAWCRRIFISKKPKMASTGNGITLGTGAALGRCRISASPISSTSPTKLPMPTSARARDPPVGNIPSFATSTDPSSTTRIRTETRLILAFSSTRLAPNWARTPPRPSSRQKPRNISTPGSRPLPRTSVAISSGRFAGRWIAPKPTACDWMP